MKKEITKNRTKNVIRDICISTVILFLGIIILVKSFSIQTGYENLIYAYNVNQNVNYKVNLIDNEYFEKKELEMNKTYISSLVDKINMDFTYSLSGNKKTETKYIYQIVAIPCIKYSSITAETEESIWAKQYVLVEPKEIETNGTNFVIKESVDIDFQKYNKEVQNFKKDLRIPIVAELQVKLFVRSQSKIPGVENEIMESSLMNVKMNLDEDVFKIENEFKNSENKSITEKIETEKNVNKLSVVIGSILVVIAILVILDSIRKSIKFGKRSDYEIALNRILKNYGDIVAEIVSPVEIDNLNIIEVKNFDQLLDIEEELRMPILFYETIEGEQGEFIIICDNMAYRYVIGQ